MNIHTDLIRSKCFTSSIEPSALKHSQEYRVLATLRYLYPGRFDAMITGEAPDLQDSASGTGIEVTVAVKEDDMKVSCAFSKLHQGNLRDIEKCKNTIESSGYSFVPLNDEKVAITTFGSSDGEKCFFQESIRRKTKKLQRYRTNFKRIGLAILLPEIPTSAAEEHFSEWASEVFKETVNFFDFVYVISHRFCIYYDVQEKSIEKRFLKPNESYLLATIGRMTAESELSLTDTEWL